MSRCISSSEASPTFGHENANLNRYRYSFLYKLISYTVYKHRKICICMTKCRAGFATVHQVMRYDMSPKQLICSICTIHVQSRCTSCISLNVKNIFIQGKLHTYQNIATKTDYLSFRSDIVSAICCEFHATFC